MQHRVAVLSDAVKPWKRETLPRAAVNALVNDSIDRLREYASAFHQVTLDNKVSRESSTPSQKKSDGVLTAVSVRAIASMTWGLAKLGRAPPPVLDEVSLALAARVEDMAPADVAQVAYAFSRSNVPATRLLNRMARASARFERRLRAPSQPRLLTLTAAQICVGLYYTRDWLASSLARWAWSCGPDAFLEGG